MLDSRTLSFTSYLPNVSINNRFWNMLCTIRMFSSDASENYFFNETTSSKMKRNRRLHELPDIDPIDFYPRCAIPEKSPIVINGAHQNTKKCGCSCLFWSILLISVIPSIMYFLLKNYKIIIVTSEENSSLNEMKNQVDEIQHVTEKKLQGLEEEINSLRIYLEERKTVDPESYGMCQKNLIEEQFHKILMIYDADKIGKFDYAAHYAGGSVVETPDTVPYSLNHKYIFGIFKINIQSKADFILQPNSLPGDCFAFYGTEGKIMIELGSSIQVTAVTLEHISPLLVEDQSSAPKDFLVRGMENQHDEGEILGKFTYKNNSDPTQTFKTLKNRKLFKFILLHILNNHGKQEFTCVYRFRVHSMKS